MILCIKIQELREKEEIYKMPNACAIPNCRTRINKKNKESLSEQKNESLAQFTFPSSKPKLFSKWKEFAQIEEPKPW